MIDLFRRLKVSLSGSKPNRAPADGAASESGSGRADDAFREAVDRHARGDLEGAEQIYRRILAGEPGFVPALHLLGRIHAQREDLSEAAAMFERARALAPRDADILIDLAGVHRAKGRLQEARRLLEAATERTPDAAAVQYALAGLQLESGDVASAILSLERTVALDPGHANAHNDLGAAYLDSGRYEPAQRVLDTAAELNPESALPFRNLAKLHSRRGGPEESVRCLREALARAPDQGEIRRDLAEALMRSGGAVDALEVYRGLASKEPTNAGRWRRLGEIATAAERRPEAIDCYRRSLQISPDQPAVLNNLGILLSAAGHYELAAECFDKAVRIAPDFDRGWDNLGGVCHLQGRYEEAVSAYRKALEIDPHNPVTISNLIAITNYRRQQDPGFVPALHERFRRALAPERIRAGCVPPLGKDAASGRRLRIGYVSPDFRRHSVAFFIEPVLQGHDRRRFEVYCYSDVDAPDDITARLKNSADVWRDVRASSDEELALRIAKDGIDILIDLGGHFAGNRLPVFARRPAPVQVTYLGYPATTALPELHYRISDAAADPDDDGSEASGERLIRLPDVFLCYRPPDEAPAVTLPGPRADGIVFGSFNELPKVSPEVIASFSRILARVPRSKLLLKATALSDPATRERLLQRLKAAGVAPERVELLPRTATLRDHLSLYARVDVALDTFPYNGTTTTCEALLMGVPVVTLEGEVHAGRVGASLLGTVGLSELVADSVESYERQAASLATDEKRLKIYRSSLRERLLASPLCESTKFVKALEAEYLQCLQSHAGTKPPKANDDSTRTAVAGALCVKSRWSEWMAFPDDLNQLTAYVMLEQEDWFEEETAFLRRYLSPGMRVLDVGANFGVYTVLAARCVGPSGRAVSVEPSSTTARWLRANVALNGSANTEVAELALSDRGGEVELSTERGAECNRLIEDSAAFRRSELVKSERLDDFALALGLDEVDFVKLDAEGAEKRILDGGWRFFSEQSPLVMFEIKSTDTVDLTLVNKFSALGYHPLRLLPGLDLLTPADLSRPLDEYALNLFACKPERHALLAANNLRADGSESSSARCADAASVWAYFARRAYSRPQLEGWKVRLADTRNEDKGRWMRMLGYFVFAADAEAPPSQRVSSLEAAHEIAAESVPGVPEWSRLNTLGRLAWSLGYRARAVAALEALLSSPSNPVETFDRPFLPASPEFDAIDPGQRRAAWSEACVLDRLESLQAFSSYFQGAQKLDRLERIRATGFQRAEMERRRVLVRLRHGMPVDEISEVTQVRSDDNTNPDFWLSRLEAS